MCEARQSMDTFDDLPPTEQENPRTRDISTRSIADIVGLINDEDALVAQAVAEGTATGRRRGRRHRRAARARRASVLRRHGDLGPARHPRCRPSARRRLAWRPIWCRASSPEGTRRAIARSRRLKTTAPPAAAISTAAASPGATPWSALPRPGARPTRLAPSNMRGQLGAFTAAVTCVPGSPITQLVDVADRPGGRPGSASPGPRG